jgi:hypothetical protein
MSQRTTEKARINVSIPPRRRAELAQALAYLHAQHANPFVQQAPLVVDSLIGYAQILQELQRLFPDLKVGNGSLPSNLVEAIRSAASGERCENEGTTEQP